MPLHLLAGRKDDRLTTKILSTGLGAEIEIVSQLNGGGLTKESVTSLIKERMSAAENGAYVIVINNTDESSTLLGTILMHFAPEIDDGPHGLRREYGVMVKYDWELDLDNTHHHLLSLCLS